MRLGNNDDAHSVWQFALDSKVVAPYAALGLTVERIGDLMSFDLPSLLPGRRPITVSAEVRR
jgi:hypothetical protein